jgi:hypothetical protein
MSSCNSHRRQQRRFGANGAVGKCSRTTLPASAAPSVHLANSRNESRDHPAINDSHGIACTRARHPVRSVTINRSSKLRFAPGARSETAAGATGAAASCNGARDDPRTASSSIEACNDSPSRSAPLGSPPPFGQPRPRVLPTLVVRHGRRREPGVGECADSNRDNIRRVVLGEPDGRAAIGTETKIER